MLWIFDHGFGNASATGEYWQVIARSPDYYGRLGDNLLILPRPFFSVVEKSFSEVALKWRLAAGVAGSRGENDFVFLSGDSLLSSF